MSQDEPLSLNQPMPAEMLAELLIFLYKEGQAVEESNPFYATMWYAQCLSVLRQLSPGNDDFLSMVFFSLGKAQALLGYTRQAVASLMAAGYLQEGLEPDENAADTLYVVGSALAALETYAKAKYFINKAIRRYTALGLEDKIVEARQEFQAVRAQAKKQPAKIEPVAPPYEFAVHIKDAIIDKLTVLSSGEVVWVDMQYSSEGQPLLVGLVLPWQVTCTNI